MLARYKIYRGKRPPQDPLPDGVRQDARFRTRHVLRPTKEMATAFLESGTEAAWKKFAADYRALLAERFREDRRAFDELAELAARHDVFIGCSCPTEKSPRVERCHTYLALQFMKTKYRRLRIVFPKASRGSFVPGKKALDLS